VKLPSLRLSAGGQRRTNQIQVSLTAPIDAVDGGQLLGMVHRFGWNAARVFQDGKFVFTVVLNPKGFWSIMPDLPEESPTQHTDN
jgi:hypothetical protein